MAPYKGFTTVKLNRPQRSKFDLSHEKRLSTRMGRLTPVFITETLPDDTFKCNTEVMLRMAPMLAPIMHRVNVFVHFFFVPNRLLWEDWELFITGGRLGTETPPVPPNVLISSVLDIGQDLMDEKSLNDYLGATTIGDAASATFAGRKIDIMPNLAFFKIWEDYYRDRNYVADSELLPVASGTYTDAPTLPNWFVSRTRDWQADYFTTALPFTQRGDEVLLPLQGTGDVTYLRPAIISNNSGVPINADRLLMTDDADASGRLYVGNAIGAPATEVTVENISGIEINESEVSINDLRTALALQKWMERNALAGSRYSESLMAHWGKRSSDARLQRAEYLGGGKISVKISEIVTTAYSLDADDETVPPANMAGHGLSFGNTNKFTYNCEEHGFIIGIMSVMPTSAYQQGTRRMFYGRNTFLDYPWPSFAHLGEQEVYKYELWGGDPGNVPVDRTTQPVFGYQSRYADWKYIPSSTHGDFRSTLDHWHLTRKFSSNPALGATFCTFEDVLQDRIFAVSGVDTLWCYIYNQCTVIRSLPYYGTPSIQNL